MARPPEAQSRALECLKEAVRICGPAAHAEEVVATAEKFLAFVEGRDRDGE